LSNQSSPNVKSPHFNRPVVRGMTRIVAVNGSPKMEKGNTELVLRAFLDGARDAGAEVEVLYAKKMKIEPCRGEFQCWGSKPGECVIKDEMQSIYPKLKRADILVLAMPVYAPLPGEMQTFLNRLMPLIDASSLSIKDGRTRARPRAGVRISKIVLVSSAGWWEKENMDTVVRVASELAENMNIEFSGALLRPHSDLLERGGPKVDKVLRSARECGQALVKNGKMPKATLEAVAAPLTSREEWMKG